MTLQLKNIVSSQCQIDPGIIWCLFRVHKLTITINPLLQPNIPILTSGNLQAHSRGFWASVLNVSYSNGGQQVEQVLDVRPRPATTHESVQEF